MENLLKELREELVGKEISILDLSNELQRHGCEDICDFGNIEECIQDGNMVVATDDCGEEHIQVFYKVTIERGEDEIETAYYVVVESIEEF